MNRHQFSFLTVVKLLVILAAVWVCEAFILLFLPNSAMSIPVAACATVLLIFSLLFPAETRAVGNFCFRYRWALTLVLFLLCVCLRVHGSSIGMYDEMFPSQIMEEETTLFGKPRGIRSDEFGVMTPVYFSQNTNSYRFYSEQMSLSSTNMVLDFYSPVWDWTVLGKPLSWGFLLFGNEVGLSWYWCGEILLLFMTALEMCLILTGRKRMLSLLGAFMIALSPAIQWWVMPHMPPVILYSMALFCLGYWFFTAKTPLARWASAGLSVIAVTGYVLSIFPSFQVACGYAVLILLAACLSRDRADLTFTRREWFRVALPAVAVLLVLGRFLLLSRDDLGLMINTVYPGRRMSLGGDRWVADLFTDFTSFFLPYQDVAFSNNCEAATYIHFAPFFFVLSPYLLSVLKKKRDSGWFVGAALTGVLFVQCAYMLIGFPQWLAEVTLLRYCNRMHEVYGWTATLFTVWGLGVLISHPELLTRRTKLLIPLVFGAVWLLTLDGPRREYFAQFVRHNISLGTALIALTLTGSVCVLYSAMYRHQKFLCAAMILVMFFCGATVNPLERGIGAVTNHPVSKAVSEIAAQEPESSWLCLDSDFLHPNFLLANGARTLNAFNMYPDTEKWAILDPEGHYEELTNRYANQSAELTEGVNAVELLNPDYIRLRLNPVSLKELGIRYLFTPVDHTALLDQYGIICTYLDGQDGYGIYRLDYQK